MPEGLCACGCGETTPIARKTDRRKGYRAGEHTKYCPGHVQRTQGKTAALVSQFGTELTGQDLKHLRLNATDDIAATVLEERAVAIVRFQGRSFVELGMICQEMDERGLWAKLVHPDTGLYYHSFPEWATTRLGVSRSKAFAAKKVIEATKGNVAVEDLQDMTRQNLTQFARLSSKVQRKPKVLRDAKTLTEDKFVAELEKHEPDQHIAKVQPVKLNLDATQRANFDEMIEVAKWVWDLEFREDALDAVVLDFLDEHCAVIDNIGLTNREAFAMAKKGGRA